MRRVFFQAKKVDKELVYSAVQTLGDSLGVILNSPPHQSKVEKKKKLRSEFINDEEGENQSIGDEDDDSKSTSRETMKRMAKRISFSRMK